MQDREFFCFIVALIVVVTLSMTTCRVVFTFTEVQLIEARAKLPVAVVDEGK